MNPQIRILAPAHPQLQRAPLDLGDPHPRTQYKLKQLFNYMHCAGPLKVTPHPRFPRSGIHTLGPHLPHNQDPGLETGPHPPNLGTSPHPLHSGNPNSGAPSYRVPQKPFPQSPILVLVSEASDHRLLPPLLYPPPCPPSEERQSFTRYSGIPVGESIANPPSKLLPHSSPDFIPCPCPMYAYQPPPLGLRCGAPICPRPDHNLENLAPILPSGP